MKLHALAIAASLATTVACGGESSSTADAAVDAPPDAPPLAPFIGDWLRDGFTPAAPDIPISFRAGGEFVYGAEVGTWSLDGDDLVTFVPSRGREAAPYYLAPDGQTMLMVALRPTGPTDGVLGTWRGQLRLGNEAPRVNTFEFRGDGTMTWSNPTPHPGTWTLTGNSLEMRVDLGQISTVGLRVIPDVALGDGYLTRVP